MDSDLIDVLAILGVAIIGFIAMLYLVTKVNPYFSTIFQTEMTPNFSISPTVQPPNFFPINIFLPGINKMTSKSSHVHSFFLHFTVHNVSGCLKLFKCLRK